MEHPPTIFTIGHGARSIEAFISLLDAVSIGRLIDVRTAPASRKHPHFGKDALARTLEEHGVEYIWRKELGGWRKPAPDSRHIALTSPGFRGYADHMGTTAFHDVLIWLIVTSLDTATAAMCAESLWWRCHRRMLADALVARGCDVQHIVEGGRLQPHRLHPTARIANDAVIYDRI